MSFSAHADAKGIMQLIRHCEPKNVVLVHGEGAKMEFLRQQVMKEFGKLFLAFAYFQKHSVFEFSFLVTY
jgi:Cft2 family RNA processing exonuclease